MDGVNGTDGLPVTNRAVEDKEVDPASVMPLSLKMGDLLAQGMV